MELGVSHVQSLSSLTPVVDNIFDKYNKNLVPIRSLSDHDNKVVDEKFLSNGHRCMVWTLVSCNKELWYVSKIMGLYFSGITRKNELPLSASLSFHVSI